jgi:endonuclease YncB( thermonuclease family)
VVVVTTDRFGRTVGTVYRNNTNINREMVLLGYAWWYPRYAPYDRQLADAEQVAQAQRLGLWADANPIASWDWRRGVR